MYLTREEQLSVVSRVLEANNVSINEARGNDEIRERLKLNLEFYNSAKGDLGENSLNEGFLSAMGDIKDLWTAATEQSTLLAKLREIVLKVVNTFKPVISKFIPANIRQQGNEIGNETLEYFQKIADFFYKKFGYKGLAKIFARIKYRKLTSAPTAEQINCMVPFAKVVCAILYIALVTFFIIKLLPILAAKLSASAAAAGTAQMSQASFTAMAQPLVGVFNSVGQGSILKGLFSFVSTGFKAKRAKEYAAKVNGTKEDAIKNLFSNFSKTWNTCSLPKN